MKPILTVNDQEDTIGKKVQASLNTVFEDIYNNLSKLYGATSGGTTLTRPHIDSVSTGFEFNYAYLLPHCLGITDAKLYCWAVRRYGTQRWTECFSTTNEPKIVSLYFASEYEIKVKVFGMMLIDSEWSAITLTTTAAAPVPSKVTGVTITNEPLYIDPTTGVTLASIKVEWNNNADDELVDTYEVLWWPTE